MFNRKTILFSFLLFLPAIAVYIFYFINTPKNHFATGFIQSDMYSYMAEARQYEDEENNGLFYSNPFDGDKKAPKIYFQPQIFFLGMILKYVGLNPSTLFLLFGILFGWLFMISAISLYSQFFELKSKISVFGLIVFIYGGGALFICSTVWMLFNGFNPPSIEFFRYDPGYGWWMLNLGRNLIYPMESYYHFLILITFVMFFKKQHIWVCIILIMLSWSHPFYGIEFLSVFGVIYLFEFVRYKRFLKTEKHPYFPIIIIGILFLIHVYYYLLYLPSFPSHQSLMNQWKISWSHSGITLIFAYIFGVVLTIININTNGGFLKFFSDYKNRVLGIWFIVCFLFVNHNWFMTSYQPLHFDKGYVLAPLWLMGLPTLFLYLQKIKKNLNLLMLRFGFVLIIIVLLSDNLFWFLAARGDRNSYVKKSEKELFEYINNHFTTQNILISNDDEFSSKAMVFTSCRSWVSHGYNTPYYSAKRDENTSLINGIIRLKLISEKKQLIIVFNKQNIPNELNRKFFIIFENKDYVIAKILMVAM